MEGVLVVGRHIADFANTSQLRAVAMATTFWLWMSYNFSCIKGIAVALHCCKAHSEINRKTETSTPCKIVTLENFILKLVTRDYVEAVTYYKIFDVH